MKWKKANIVNTEYNNIEHDELRDLIQDTRFNSSDFGQITLYTEYDAVDILDEIFSLGKFSNLYVVFNYNTPWEYIEEL